MSGIKEGVRKMKSFKMFINGEFVNAKSGKTTTAVNPATEEVIAEFPMGGKEDVDIAVAAAKKAFPIWSKKSMQERSEILNKLADSIFAMGPDLGELESADHGFPLKMAGFMSMGAAMKFKEAAEQAKSVMGSVAPRRASAMIYMQREPIGVCGLITPWNVPLIMSAAKLSVALAAGNTCVLKPPTTDSLSTLKLAEAIAKSGLPVGAVNIVTGSGREVGEALATHPDVRMIGFTGSSETGKRIMELGSRTMKRMALELGGKNPFIVLDDANVDAAVQCAVHSQYGNCGQICASPRRYYLHEKIYAEFVDKFIAGSKSLVTGDPRDPKNQMGPVVNKEQRDVVESYIKSGVDQGARLELGGKRPAGKGYYVKPAVFTGVTLDMTIAREEIFGPVACIMKPWNSEEQMLQSVNDNAFGLGGSVWSRNTVRAMKIADQIESGAVWINDHLTLSDGMPWGGVKESGIGRENAPIGMDEYTQLKTINLNLTY
jgi:acyl-CoA reductase-like NAD-dependent aldehyde dehydrogenase